MANTAWAHLPNAQHIDWVLASLKRNPQAWGDARNRARSAPWDRALDAAWGDARNGARDKAWNRAWNGAWDNDQGAARGAALIAARGACAAFTAWDDATDVWVMPTDAVRLLAAVGDHRAILLLPACTVRDQA